MKKAIFLIICLLSITINYSQQISGKVTDGEFNQPLAFVNIQLTENKGSISNNEGAFTIDVSGLEASHKVEFSFMGFETLRLSVEELKENAQVIMKPSIELLDQVVISDRNLSAVEIINKFNENREKNHQLTNQRYRLFTRGKTQFLPEQMMFKLKKANNLKRKERKNINDALNEINERISGTRNMFFAESLKDVYKKDSVYLTDYIKRIRLTDTDAKGSIDDYKKEALSQLFENLESDNTFKMKIGIIKVADSVDINSDDDSFMVSTSTEEDQEEDEVNESATESFLKRKSLLNKNTLPQALREPEYFEYTLEESSIINGRPQYVISFEPDKRKAKFEGKMYIDQKDFALTQIDYQLADGKKTESINLKLLGLKFNQHKAENSIRYAKNEAGFYVPYYVSETEGRYAFLRRTLTFIENHPERSERIKFKLRFIIELNMIETTELVLVEQESIEEKAIDQTQFNTSVEAEILETYDPSIWEDYPIFEATEEMKTFHINK